MPEDYLTSQNSQKKRLPSISQKQLPVLSYATGRGWQELGRARTIAGARRLISTVLSDHSTTLVTRYGFQLVVSLRTPLQIELNGGPEGYVWSLVYSGARNR